MAKAEVTVDEGAVMEAAKEAAKEVVKEGEAVVCMS